MNYKKKFNYFIILVFFHSLAFGQDNAAISNTVTPTDKSKYIPTIGVGIGVCPFFGDVGYKNLSDPLRYKLGYGISIEEKLFNHFSFSYEFIYGKTYSNDKSINSFNNFEATIISNTLNINYFPFKAPNRILRPYISLGFGALYYQTNLDLKDANNNPYYYWSDNTIKNISETSPNASSAVIINRDYKYETAKPGLFTMTVPFGFGFNFNFSNKLSLNVGPTMYFTFSEKIDNISSTKNSLLTNDRFLYASFSLRYDLAAPKYKNPADANFENINFLALENQDTDGDGVIDSKDKCANTPTGEKVDLNGCPLDDDRDGVPNYKDQELASKPGAIVDELGIELTDEYLAKKEAARKAKDSLSLVVKEVRLPDSGVPVSFIIQLGTFKNGIPPEQVDKFLVIPDVKNNMGTDSVITYSVGPLSNIKEAEDKKNEYVSKGIKDATLIGYSADGREVDLEKYLPSNNRPEYVSGSSSSDSSATTANSGVNNTLIKGGIVYKVQLGAFSKSSVNKNVFKDIKDLSKETHPNGTTRYFAGSYSSLKQANSYRDKARKIGFETAFTVVYKDGVRLDSPVVKEEEGADAVNTDDVVFKVQLGAFKSEVAPEKMKGINNVSKETTETGYTRYLSGSFNSFEEAYAEKEKIKQNEEFKGAYVVSYKGNKQVKLSKVIPARVQEENARGAAKKMIIDKNNLVFKVQLGIFKNEVPADILAVYLTLPDVTHEKTANGLTRFMSRSFKDFVAAKAYKEDVESKGVKTPFVIAFEGNKVVPLQDAVDALK